MKARMRKGVLVITLPLLNPPKLSRSGKRLVVATSRGARRTRLKQDGKPIYPNVNVYRRPDEQQSKKEPKGSKTKALRKWARKR